MKEKNKKWKILFLVGLFLVPGNVFAFEKKETVYTNLHTDGSISKVSVTNHLSHLEDTRINDETRLKNILNINGNETFTLKDGNLVWDSKKDDIFYKGEGEDTLPIQANITYYLDNKEMSAKDMVGKKGKIKIVYSFTNKEKQDTYINGKKKTLYTPFVVTLGTIIENTNNKDIVVNSGKVVNTGTKSMVVAVASPGLYESTSLPSFQGMDTIEITYDTQSFKLGSVYLVATPKLLEEADLSVFTKMDSLYQKVDTLKASMDQIQAGVEKLAAGSSQLQNGAEAIYQNLETVQNSIVRLKEGSVSIDQGIQQILSALPDLQDLHNLVQANNNAILAILSKNGKTLEDLASSYVTNGLKDYTGTDTTLLSDKFDYEMIVLLKQNIGAANATIASMDSLKAAFISLERGASALTGGLSQLQTGIHQLYDGAGALVNGVQELSTGTQTLLTGTRTFNKDGIGALVQVSDGIRHYSSTFKKLVQLSEDYNGYASSNSKTTLFVYMVEASK